eukprot:Rmarinus@m.1217
MSLFEKDFQGGPFFEVFSTKGGNPLANWKIVGDSVKKEYDKDVKGYIFICDGGPNAKMQLPKNATKGMRLMQRFLILQVYLPHDKPFTLELHVSDTSKSKRRIIFSSALKEPAVTPLHARVPINYVRRGVWINLAFDMPEVVAGCFKGMIFKSVDLLLLSPCCKLRRIFTMRAVPYDTTGEAPIYPRCPENLVEPIPGPLDFPATLEHETQIFTIARIRALSQRPESPPKETHASRDKDKTGGLSSTDPKYRGKMHVAFGHRAPLPPTPPSPAKPRKTSTAGSGRTGTISGRSTPSSSRDDINAEGEAGEEPTSRRPPLRTGARRQSPKESESPRESGSDRPPRTSTLSQKNSAPTKKSPRTSPSTSGRSDAGAPSSALSPRSTPPTSSRAPLVRGAATGVDSEDASSGGNGPAVLADGEILSLTSPVDDGGTGLILGGTALRAPGGHASAKAKGVSFEDEVSSRDQRAESPRVTCATDEGEFSDDDPWRQTSARRPYESRNYISDEGMSNRRSEALRSDDVDDVDDNGSDDGEGPDSRGQRASVDPALYASNPWLAGAGARASSPSADAASAVASGASIAAARAEASVRENERAEHRASLDLRSSGAEPDVRSSYNSDFDSSRSVKDSYDEPQGRWRGSADLGRKGDVYDSYDGGSVRSDNDRLSHDGSTRNPAVNTSTTSVATTETMGDNDYRHEEHGGARGGIQ